MLHLKKGLLGIFSIKMKDQKRQGTAQILLSLFAQICFLILFLKVFFYFISISYPFSHFANR